MNVLQIKELKRQALDRSRARINEDTMIYVLVKNGKNLGTFTSSATVCLSLIENDGFSLYAKYMNGEKYPIDPFNNDDIRRAASCDYFFEHCDEMNKLEQVDFLCENCGYNYDDAWMLVYGE